MACYLATLIKFQSTLPREERPVRRYSLPLISVNFNPRSHERSDNIQNLTFALTKRFQSTLPREERHVLDIYIYDMCIFQSTLPREERRKKQSYNVRNRQFQSTLPREERLVDCGTYSHSNLFQSTLPREERRRGGGQTPCIMYISIHAPTRGATCSLEVGTGG